MLPGAASSSRATPSTTDLPSIYGIDDHLARTGAAWLLWGYGISAWIAFVLAERRSRRNGPAVEPRPAIP